MTGDSVLLYNYLGSTKCTLLSQGPGRPGRKAEKAPALEGLTFSGGKRQETIQGLPQSSSG